MSERMPTQLVSLVTHHSAGYDTCLSEGINDRWKFNWRTAALQGDTAIGKTERQMLRMVEL